MEGGAVNLSDTILKGSHPGTIPARLGLIWFSGFRGEDLNVKVYDVRRTPSDGKSSHDLWPGELKLVSHTAMLKYILQIHIARSSLTYILGFSVKIFFQPIYTDYAN
jgi:hypothetical protein